MTFTQAVKSTPANLEPRKTSASISNLENIPEGPEFSLETTDNPSGSIDESSSYSTSNLPSGTTSTFSDTSNLSDQSKGAIPKKKPLRTTPYSFLGFKKDILGNKAIIPGKLLEKAQEYRISKQNSDKIDTPYKKSKIPVLISDPNRSQPLSRTSSETSLILTPQKIVTPAKSFRKINVSDIDASQIALPKSIKKTIQSQPEISTSPKPSTSKGIQIQPSSPKPSTSTGISHQPDLPDTFVAPSPISLLQMQQQSYKTIPTNSCFLESGIPIRKQVQLQTIGKNVRPSPVRTRTVTGIHPKPPAIEKSNDKCPYCGKGPFSRLYNLNRHITTFHPNADTVSRQETGKAPKRKIQPINAPSASEEPLVASSEYQKWQRLGKD